MVSKLSESQKIRLDREILTSGVTSRSRTTTRHKNAAEQALLEQRLNDLDLQRRRSIQAISEQEKNLLRSFKAKSMNQKPQEQMAKSKRKTSLIFYPNDKTSTKPAENHGELEENTPIQPNKPLKTKNILAQHAGKKPTRSNSTTTRANDSSGLYDAYFAFTPAFLRKEYEEEEERNAKNPDIDPLCLSMSKTDFSQVGVEIPKALRFSRDVSEFPLRGPTPFPLAGHEFGSIPNRRRALSLQITPGNLFPTQHKPSFVSENTLRSSAKTSSSELKKTYNQHEKDEHIDNAENDNLKPGVLAARNRAQSDPGTDCLLTPSAYYNRRTITTSEHAETIAKHTSARGQGDLLGTPNMKGPITEEAILQRTHNNSTKYASLQQAAQATLVNSPSPQMVSQNRLSLPENSFNVAEVGRENRLHQLRRNSICTDKLADRRPHDDDRDAQWEELDFHIMGYTRQQLYTENNNSSDCSNVIRNEGVNRRRISCSDGINSSTTTTITTNSSSRYAIASNQSTSVLTRKKNNSSDSNNGYYNHINHRNENSSNNGSRKNSCIPENNGKHIFHNSNSCSNYNSNNNKKNTNDNCKSEGTCKSSGAKRKHSLFVFNSRKNSTGNTLTSSNNSIIHETSEDARSSGTGNSTEEDNSNQVHRDVYTSDDGDPPSIFSVGKRVDINAFESKTNTKVLLEASARQLLSTLQKTPVEENKATQPEDQPASHSHTRPSTPARTCENDIITTLQSEPQHDRETTDNVSLRATSATPRRPSGGGNFFLVAKALKSGQLLGKLNFQSDRPKRVSSIPSDHPCALRDYQKRTTSVKRLAGVHGILQSSALCMVEEEKERQLSSLDVFA